MDLKLGLWRDPTFTKLSSYLELTANNKYPSGVLRSIHLFFIGIYKKKKCLYATFSSKAISYWHP